MAMFNSYVSSPEGIWLPYQNSWQILPIHGTTSSYLAPDSSLWRQQGRRRTRENHGKNPGNMMDIMENPLECYAEKLRQHVVSAKI